MYLHIQKGTLILIAGIVILVSSFVVPWDMFLPPFQVVQKWEWEIGAGSVGTLALDLVWGTHVHGLIDCWGGNDDIDFSITDSAGNVLYSPGVVFKGYKFRWQAPSTDIFHFKFDNTEVWKHSAWSDRTVGYSIGLYYYFHVLLLVGIIATIVGVYFIVKGAIEMATKKRRILCKHCGTMNLEGAIYCTECGKKIG